MSDLVFKGRIEKIHEVQEGVSNNGNAWKKLGFLVTETEGQYPNSLGVTVFGNDKVDNFLKYNKVGQEVEVQFNTKCREYSDKNGVERFSNDINSWRINSVGGSSSAVDQYEGDSEPEDEDDLPF
jgi:hypothetical protein